MLTTEFISELQRKVTEEPRCDMATKLSTAIRLLQEVAVQASFDHQSCNAQQLDEQIAAVDVELSMLAGFYKATADATQQACDAALRALYNVKGTATNLNRSMTVISGHLQALAG